MITRRATTIVAIAIIATLAVYLLRLDPVAGMFVDDAWYIVLARAIATGQGYRLISSATAQVLPTVPPGFPVLLAPIVAVLPRFPDHVIWMKLLSIAAIMAAAAICWRDFVRHRGLSAVEATLIVGAAVLTPALVFLATSAVMPEGVYLLAQVAAVIAVERISRREPGDDRAAIVAATLSAIAMLIRTSAAALIAAAVVYLVVRRRWRQAAVFAAVVIVAMLPWWWYSAAHAPTDEERASHGSTMAYSYSQLLRANGLARPDEAASTSALVDRAVENGKVIFTRDIGALFVPVMYRGADESGQEVFSIGRPGFGDMGVAPGTMVISAVLAVIIAIGWLGSTRERFAMPGLMLAATMPMLAPVGGQTFRYLVPLTPFIVMFFWRGLRSPAVARIALLIVIGLHLMDHAAYIHERFTGAPEWIADWNETNELLTWIAGNVPPQQGIATTNPGLIYLATGRKTIAIDGLRTNWERWRASGVRYVASTDPRSDLPPESLGYIERFRSNHRAFWVVEMTGK